MLRRSLALRSLLRNERKPLAELERHRDAALRRIVRHAWEHVPFYRQLYDRERVDPAMVRSAADLNRLPIIDKALLRSQPVDDVLSDSAGPRSALARFSTSGSSGTPFDVYADRRYEQFRKAQSLRPYLSNGRRLTDRGLMFTVFDAQAPKAFERLGVLREHRVGGSLRPERQLETWNAVRPDVVQGYPSTLATLAAHVRDTRASAHRPRLLFTDSELLSGPTRALIERVFGRPVVDVFGTWETGNIAYECGHRSGHHVAIDCVILEIVARDGSVARPGEQGELVCTVLHNRAMPLIRYNLHDVAAWADGTCGCGRSLPRLRVIEGRTNDLVRLADGRSMSPEALLSPLAFLGDSVLAFQVVQEAPDAFRVIVVPTRAYDDTCRDRIRAAITNFVASASVRVDVVDDIPREVSGKRRVFRSLVAS